MHVFSRDTTGPYIRLLLHRPFHPIIFKGNSLQAESLNKAHFYVRFFTLNSLKIMSVRVVIFSHLWEMILSCVLRVFLLRQ
jgi:hypothetical protein